MTAALRERRRRLPRPSLVMLPNGFTLANLFFGIFAIVAASRGQHTQAGWYIVIGGFCDALDGRIARATGTGSPFGEELDSLVDAISFGLAPALIVYMGIETRANLDWLLVFIYTACAVNYSPVSRKHLHRLSCWIATRWRAWW